MKCILAWILWWFPHTFHIHMAGLCPPPVTTISIYWLVSSLPWPGADVSIYSAAYSVPLTILVIGSFSTTRGCCWELPLPHAETMVAFLILTVESCSPSVCVFIIHSVNWIFFPNTTIFKVLYLTMTCFTVLVFTFDSVLLLLSMFYKCSQLNMNCFIFICNSRDGRPAWELVKWQPCWLSVLFLLWFSSNIFAVLKRSRCVMCDRLFFFICTNQWAMYHWLLFMHSN